MLKTLIGFTFVAFFAPGVWADNLSVDCSGATPGAFTSIQAAINSLPVNAATEPHTITVTGT